MHDVCIVGAGPAGLNAALVLGRCQRDVIVFDSGQPRNAASRGLHGYLSRDGIPPQELRALGRRELSTYPSVTVVDREVVSANHKEDHFVLVTGDGTAVKARTLLLATGRVDVVPSEPGFRTFYGRGVYHCPYCDGWEHRGKPLAAFGECPAVVELALALLTWSDDVTLCAADHAAVSAPDRERLEAHGIKVAAANIAELVGEPQGVLQQVRLKDGRAFACEAMFFTSDLPQKSLLAQSLGCKLDDCGSVICAAHAATGVPGLFVAGNVRGGVHLAIMAAAEGAEAAIGINELLSEQELGHPAGDAEALT